MILMAFLSSFLKTGSMSGDLYGVLLASSWIGFAGSAWASLLHDPIIRTYAYSYDVYTTCTGPFLNSFDSCCDELCYVEAEYFAFLRGSWMLKLGRRSCRSWQNDNRLNLLMLDVFWAMVTMRSGHWQLATGQGSPSHTLLRRFF